ncbi:hypothetical protein IW138_001873 [Coemansia sp. RSA 986]|nr:hypothetical protein IW138_001873 [Coemansia sp. RSA 986]
MRVPSEILYENKLVPDPSIANRLLCDIAGIHNNNVANSALVLINTTKKTNSIEGSDVTKKVYLSGRANPIVVGGSKTNKGEVGLVLKYVKQLVGYGTNAEDIAVITPYAGQVRLLKLAISQMYPGISIGTVDGFQSLEKKAIILSLVRSNTKVVGFLKDCRHLCIIANRETVAYKSRVLESLFEHMDRYATKLGD